MVTRNDVVGVAPVHPKTSGLDFRPRTDRAHGFETLEVEQIEAQRADLERRVTEMRRLV